MKCKLSDSAKTYRHLWEPQSTHKSIQGPFTDTCRKEAKGGGPEFSEGVIKK